MNNGPMTAAERARWYLKTIVKPTVAECVANQGDVRHALLAAIVVSHLADYIALVQPKDEIKDLVHGCEFLAVARNVSDAAKHGITLTKGLLVIEPHNLDAVRDDGYTFEGLGHGSGPHGTLPDPDGKYRYPGIIVRRRDDDWSLHGVVQEAMWFLERKLAAKEERAA